MSDSQHDYYILYEQAQQEIEKLVSDSVKKFREKNVEIEKLKAEKTKQEMQIAGLIKHGAIQHERITKLTRQRDNALVGFENIRRLSSREKFLSVNGTIERIALENIEALHETGESQTPRELLAKRR